jgi:hypothetical protein
MKLSFFDSVELVVIELDGSICVADITSLIDRYDSESDEELSKLGAELKTILPMRNVKNLPSPREPGDSGSL